MDHKCVGLPSQLRVKIKATTCSVSEPWIPMGQLQEFLGLEKIISEKNFDMDDKLPCFKENVETKCLKGTKGRSVGKNFENDLGSVLK